MKKKPRVLYIIYSSTLNSGGGHFYSLNAISSGLKDVVDFKILNLGATLAPPLKDNPSVVYIDVFKYNLFVKLANILKFVKDFKPQTIHAFDTKSLFIARVLALFLRVTVVFTKCGGRNGSRNIPDSDSQIFFSRENFDHFERHGNINIPKYLIPNRVGLVKIDKVHTESFKNDYSLHSNFILLRISRFNSYYDLTFKQSIELLKKYLVKNENAVLVLVGKIQSEEYFENIQSQIEGLPIVVVTQDKYTREASRLLNIANVVIATGRGVMEACSLNKIVHCPVRNSTLPIMLNDSSVKHLLTMNFSERAFLENISNDSFDGTRKYFDEFFSVETVKGEYLKIYSEVERQPFHFFNFIIHMLQFFKPKI